MSPRLILARLVPGALVVLVALRVQSVQLALAEQEAPGEPAVSVRLELQGAQALWRTSQATSRVVPG